jgi:hypothetical protein
MYVCMYVTYMHACMHDHIIIRHDRIAHEDASSLYVCMYV